MADQLTSLIPSDTEPGGDAMVLTRLADQLVKRIPMLCTLKTFYDGKESVPTKAVPNNVNGAGATEYKRFVSVCPMNLSSTIANAVITSQRPTGFRLIADKTMRSTEADDMWDQSGMGIKSLNMLRDVNVYGTAYAMVLPNPNPSYIVRLSPWNTIVSEDKSAAVTYTYDPDEGMEYLTLYRLERDENGMVTNVYSRTAKNETDKRNLYDDTAEDAESIYNEANGNSAQEPSLPATFEWEGSAKGSAGEWDHAIKCGCLPVVQLRTPTGFGQFEQHIPALSSIDQQRFHRFCIQEMQTFRQRWISGDLPEYYTKQDPAVKAGKVQAGDKIDYSQLFEMGPAALWLMPKDAKIGESQVTDITPLVTAVSNDIRQLAGATGTPLSILSPDVAGSAEGAKLTTLMLRRKVEDMNARANDAFVLLLRMALASAGESSNDVTEERFETMWEPVELPSDVEQTQAAANVKGILPVKTIMRRYLYMSEMDIAEAMQDLQDTAFASALSREKAVLDTHTDSQQMDTLSDTLSGTLSDTGSDMMSDLSDTTLMDDTSTDMDAELA